MCLSTSTLDTILCKHTSAQHRNSERIRGSSKKRFEEKCLRKYVFAEIKSAFMFVWLCAEYFCAVFFLSTFLTVSIGMRWLCWPIASWQIYKKNEEDGTVNGQIFNIFCRFQFRLEWRAKCFELLLQQLLLLLPRAEIETLNWISFDANIEIISNSYSLCPCNSNSFYDGFYFFCPLIQKYNVLLCHLFGSKKNANWPTAK